MNKLKAPTPIVSSAWLDGLNDVCDGDRPSSFAAPSGSAYEDAELVAFAWFATAHPHEAYATWPERFWLFFQTKCPGKTRSEMEKMLAETAETPNAEVRHGGPDAPN